MSFPLEFLSIYNPLGTSMDTMFVELLLINLINDETSRVGFLFNPVPNMASIIKSSFDNTGNDFSFFKKNIFTDVLFNRLRFVSKSGEPGFSLSKIKTDTLYLSWHKCLAIARPSPPLFPFPQNMFTTILLF